MRLVDTSAWIEWLLGSSAGMRIRASLPTPDNWLVPTIVQLELAKWLTRVQGDDATDQVIAFTRTCKVAALDTEIALAAAGYCREFKLATADAVIYATARTCGADLLTCDAHFQGLPDAIWIPKTLS